MPVSDEFHRHLHACDEPTLIALLRVMQARLGTPEEGPDDVDRCAAVMHQLNNLRTIRIMMRDAYPPGAPEPEGAR